MAPVSDAEQPRTVTAQPSSPSVAVPAAATPEVVPPRLIMFDVGLHKPVGKGSDNYYPGLRAGMLLGGRLGAQVSGNAEVVIDLLNPDTPQGVSVTELLFDLTFSPLFHFPVSPTAQFVLGPRLGVFYLAESVSFDMQSASAWAWGWAWGANAGFLAAQSATRIGLLASFNARTPEKFCGDTPTSAEECISEGLNTAKMLSLAFLVML